MLSHDVSTGHLLSRIALMGMHATSAVLVSEDPAIFQQVFLSSASYVLADALP